MRKLPLLFLSILILSLFYFQPVKAQTPHVLEVTCSEPYYYVKGDVIQVKAYSNISIDATLKVYWNWRTFSENQLIYSNTKELNATWNLPTVNQKPGFYKIVVSTSETTVTMWRTLIHITDYQPTSLPFTHTWQTINYAFEGRTLNATHLDDYISITYPTVPFPYTANLYTNNMSFLIRLSGSGWDVDITYFTIHMGLKWILNGTIPEEKSFDFQCSNNPSKIWDVTLYEFKSLNTHLTFSWIDLALEQHEFVFNATTQVLTVTIPDSGGFKIDPVIFEDGFESGYTPWTGTSTSGSSTIGINQTIVHHGANSSKHVYIAGGNTYAYIDLGANYETVYMRVYFYLDNYSLGALDEFTFFSLQDSGSDRLKIGCRGTTPRLRRRFYDGSWSNALGSFEFSLDTWYCVEGVYFGNDSSNGGCQVWIDGVNQTDVALGGRNTGGYYVDRAVEGSIGDSSAEDAIFFNDCIIVADEYIGCEAVGLDLAYILFENFLIWSSVTATLEQVGLDLAYTLFETVRFFSSITRGIEKGYSFSEVVSFFSSVTATYEGVAYDLYYTLFETVRFYAAPIVSLEVAVVALTINDVASLAALAFILGIIAFILIISKMGLDAKK